MLFLLVLSVLWAKPLIANGGVIQQAFWFGAPLNIRLLLDGFSLFMLFTISLISFAVTLYSIDYMEHYGAKANYYALLLVMIAGMNGLVLCQRPVQYLPFPGSGRRRLLRAGRLRPGPRMSWKRRSST